MSASAPPHRIDVPHGKLPGHGVGERWPSSPGYRGDRLPPIRKELVLLDGSAFWMISHPREAASMICCWFDRTMGADVVRDSPAQSAPRPGERSPSH